MGTDLEAILEAGYNAKLRIFLFPLQKPGNEWFLKLTIMLASMKTFLTFRVVRYWMTCGVGVMRA